MGVNFAKFVKMGGSQEMKQKKCENCKSAKKMKGPKIRSKKCKIIGKKLEIPAS